MTQGIHVGLVWILVQGWMNPATHDMMVALFRNVVTVAEVLVTNALTA